MTAGSEGQSSWSWAVLRFRIRFRRIHVLGSPGSGSIFQRYGSGSGTGSKSGYFYYKAKIVGKTLIPTVLWLLYDFLSLQNYVTVPSKRISTDENSRIRIRIRIQLSEVWIGGFGSGIVPKFHESATLELSGSLDVERWGDLKLGTVSGQGLTGAVGQLLAGLQVQPLNVIAVLGKGGQSRVSHCLYIEKTLRTF